MKTTIWTARDQDRLDRERWDRSAAGRREAASLERQQAERLQRAREDLILGQNPEIGVLQRASGRAFYAFLNGPTQPETEAPLDDLVQALAPKRQREARALLGIG